MVRRGDAHPDHPRGIADCELDVGEAPRIEISGPEMQEESLTLYIRTHHPRSQVSLVVLFTGDDGKTWSPVAIDPNETNPLVVNATSLTGGESCRFRAVATAETGRHRRTAIRSRCPAEVAGC